MSFLSTLFTRKQELLDKIEEQEEQINYLNDIIEQKNKKINMDEQNKTELEKAQAERLKNAERLNDQLCITNDRLVEWIDKIINEASVYKVDDPNRTFTIPIYKRDNTIAAYNYDNTNNSYINPREEIVIPQIRILKFE